MRILLGLISVIVLLNAAPAAALEILLPNFGQAPELKRLEAQLIDRAIVMAQEDSNLAANVQGCMQNPSVDPMCSDMTKFMAEQFRPLLHAARLHLALSKDDRDGNLVPNPVRGYNLRLMSGILKEVPWSPLSADEIQLVKNTEKLEYEQSLADAKIEKRASIGPDLLNKLVQLTAVRRAAHRVAYARILDDYPIIQYIASPEAKDAEIAVAAESVRKNISARISELQVARFKLDLQKNAELSSDDLFDLLSTPSVLSTVLAQDSSLEPLAHRLAQIYSSRNTAGSLVMAASLFAGAEIGLPLILAGSAIQTSNAFNDYQRTKRNYLRRATKLRDDDTQMDDILAARRGIIQAVVADAMLPLGVFHAQSVIAISSRASRSVLRAVGL